MAKKSFLTALLVVMAVLCAGAQNLNGRLADENGEPVAFANMTLKQAVNDSIVAGLTSDENGNFSVDVKDLSLIHI